MNYKSIFLFLKLMLNFSLIIGYSNNLDDVFSLVNIICKLYQKSSTIIIADENNLRDFHFQKQLIEEIRKSSENGLAFQSVSYSGVERFKENLLQNDNRKIRTQILFTVFIKNKKSFEHFQTFIRVWNIQSSMWLVLMEKQINFHCEQPQGNPFDLELNSAMIVKCGNNTALKKYYSIFKDTIEVVEFGIWTPEKKLITSNNVKIIQEKINLKGVTLSQVALTNAPNRFNPNSRKFYSEVINLMKIVGNFTTKIIIEKDTNGIYNSTSNQWVGITKVLEKKMVDLSDIISVSRNRMEVMDFTIPIKTLKNKIFLKLPDRIDIRWNSYFQVFNEYAWIAIILMISISSLLLLLTKKEKKNMDSFLKVFINVWSIFCQQGILDMPLNKSTQILYFTIMSLSLLLNAIYSASITSYMTVITIDLPFDSYEDFVKRNFYKVIVIRGSKEHDDIISDDELLLPLKNKLVSYWELPIQIIDAFKQICTDSTAFYNYELDYNTLKMLSSCAIAGLSVPQTVQMSLGLAKRSPYTKMMNYYILILREKGIMNRIGSNIFFKYNPEIKSKANLINILQVIPILSIWAAGILTSIIILLFEILYYRLTNVIEENKLQYFN